LNLDFSKFSQEEIDHFYSVVSKNIRKYREAQGKRQLDLALDIDIKSVAFFSNCENNKYDKHFNLEHLYKISKILDISICDFFAEEENTDTVKSQAK
jgi:putative transcriptional regulator